MQTTKQNIKTFAKELVRMVKYGTDSSALKTTELFQTLVTAAEKEEVALIESAVPLNQKELSRIRQTIERLRGKTVGVIQRVSPDSIAGLRIRVGDLLIDTTFETKLNMMVENVTLGS